MGFQPETSTASAAAADADTDHRRREAVRRIDRERLLRYISGIIQIQTTPLRDIVRDHALPHLPAQSLLRFRSVSAGWNRLISSPFFAHTQSQTRRSLSGFFFVPTTTHIGSFTYLPLDPKADSIPDPSLSFLPDTVSVVASSRGLVVCRSVVFSDGPPRYYVCNPATTEWTALPRPRHHLRGPVALVFEPSPLNFTADYHLVCATANLACAEVFSSRSGTWRMSDAVPVIPEAAKAASLKPMSCSVSVSGVAYWRTEGGWLISYSPAADEFGVVAPPPSTERVTRRWQLGEMDGRLCWVGAGEGIVEVFALEKGGSTWRKTGSTAVAGDPWPLVVEGREERAVVWVDGRLVGVEVRSGKVAAIGEGVVEGCAEGVPYISSLAAVREFCLGRGCFTCKRHRDGFD